MGDGSRHDRDNYLTRRRESGWRLPTSCCRENLAQPAQRKRQSERRQQDMDLRQQYVLLHSENQQDVLFCDRTKARGWTQCADKEVESLMISLFGLKAAPIGSDWLDQSNLKTNRSQPIPFNNHALTISDASFHTKTHGSAYSYWNSTVKPQLDHRKLWDASCSPIFLMTLNGRFYVAFWEGDERTNVTEQLS